MPLQGREQGGRDPGGTARDLPSQRQRLVWTASQVAAPGGVGEGPGGVRSHAHEPEGFPEDRQLRGDPGGPSPGPRRFSPRRLPVCVEEAARRRLCRPPARVAPPACPQAICLFPLPGSRDAGRRRRWLEPELGAPARAHPVPGPAGQCSCLSQLWQVGCEGLSRLLLHNLSWFLPLSGLTVSPRGYLPTTLCSTSRRLPVDPWTPQFIREKGPFVLLISQTGWDLAKQRREPGTCLVVLIPGSCPFSAHIMEEPLRYWGLAVSAHLHCVTQGASPRTLSLLRERPPPRTTLGPPDLVGGRTWCPWLPLGDLYYWQEKRNW
ncbi:uncharacterized protein LOC112677382 [Canis lupus dingo]|uniref:uncharacterized protein LOC112677382 n=1 Tax=Canis lupus dingo TaxID=286419 RepID=UPI0020C530B8|nr:uncharacterized protein LOC112677382 [Canis lupus dingo]